MPNKLRRRLLTVGGIALASAYTYQRGLRYPRLSFEPRPLAKHLQTQHAKFNLDNIIHLESRSNVSRIALRAIAPQPVLSVQAMVSGWVELEINNIAQNAVLAQASASAKPIELEESISAITRSLKIKLVAGEAVTLAWNLPLQQFVFTVIGDTGGGTELDWSLERSKQLNAQFLLHLGDFNYSDGEYDRAVEQFRNSEIPVYVSIGNHDFHHRGLIYEQFLHEIGPMNHAFKLGGVRFVNIDTAADFFPAQSGQRGKLMEELSQDISQYSDNVFFTHRVLKDPRPGNDHDIGGIGEIGWLVRSMKHLGASTLLTGHVHKSAKLNYQGIHQWTAGEGLAYADIAQRKQVAKILTGTVKPGARVKFEWQDLNMPWEFHQSPTHTKNMDEESLAWYKKVVEQN